jgi:hypothetical protein
MKLWPELERANTMSANVLDELQIENLTFSSHIVEKDVGDAASLFVRGFASTNATDRHGQSIDPALFTLKVFRENPQLWLNHKLYVDQFGNTTSVGTVDEVHAVKVAEYDAERKRMTLVDLETGNLVRSNLPTEGLIVTPGMKGLWVVCHVTQPNVVADINSGKLNAFSWSGQAYKNTTGKYVKYDLHEVSLVNLPANQYALFQIGKTLFSTHATDNAGGMSTISIDLEAVKSLLPDDATTRKGGETNMSNDPTKTEVKEPALGDLLKAVSGITDAVTKQTETLSAIDTRLTTLETAAKAAVTPPVTPAAPVAKAEEPAAVAAPDANADLAKAINTLNDTVAHALTQVTGVSDRLKALEGQTAPARGAGDEDGGGTPTVEEQRKAFNAKHAAMSPAERNALSRKALATVLIPHRV